MLLWFAGLGVPAVAAVFSSRGLDYRFVLAGTVAPSLALAVAALWIMDSLLLPIAVMAAVMVGGWGRRLVQRRWLGVPIGLFCHLVLDGAWLRTGTFWWPLGSGEVAGRGLRPIWLPVIMELIGAAALWWSWRRFGLADPARRRDFRRAGRLTVAPRPPRRR
ncbi:MAG: hypothetical protein OXG55_12160 [bacterium]|nr:hypothetical protein [bacterium]MCY3952884.1 hypothetical protein [bacterium]MCY4103992.1 hypothetical protein [bacterium]